jgi:hypothetical protein
VSLAVAGADAGQFLAAVPATLREELLRAFHEITRNYRERRWEPSELNGGKLCEIVYSILRGHVDGAFPARASKPGNMVDACRALEQADAGQFARSVRIQIPRMLVALYEVRNNRGVGHVGGDVDPNCMDASVVLALAKWIMAELVRLFHGLDTVAAEALVAQLTERTLPLVWKIESELRVLAPGKSMKEKALVLLYHSEGWVDEKALVRWVEHSNPAVFRRDVLVKLHKQKLIEYDRAKGRLCLSPLGIRMVEETVGLEAV